MDFSQVKNLILRFEGISAKKAMTVNILIKWIYLCDTNFCKKAKNHEM